MTLLDMDEDFHLKRLKPLPLRAEAGIVGGGLLLFAAAAYLLLPGPPPAGELSSPPIALAVDQVQGAVSSASLEFLEKAGGRNWFLLFLSDAEKARLKSDLAIERRRIGTITLWDTVDEDGDQVRVESGGYVQDVPLKHTPRVLVVPFGPGDSVKITAIVDGGGGGLTLGVSTLLGPTLLPRLLPGETVEIPIL